MGGGCSSESEHVALWLGLVAEAEGQTRLDPPLCFPRRFLWRGFNGSRNVGHRKEQNIARSTSGAES